MLIAALFLLIISGLAIARKPHFSIGVLLLLIPHQFILKKVFDNQFGSGDLFSVWKEIIVLILLVKGLNNRRSFHPRSLLLAALFFGMVILYYIGTNNYVNGLASLRNYTFPVLLFFVVAYGKFNINTVVQIRLILISALINVVMGVVQHYYFNLPLSYYKGTVELVDENGYVQYTTPSFRIMGIERMSGTFSGPNDFGVYLALVLVLTLFVYLSNRTKPFLGTGIRMLNGLVMLGSAFCLYMSYSRAGWGIVAVSMAVYFFRSGISRSNQLVVMFGVVVGALLVMPMLNISDDNVLVNSLNGKEASASDRSNQFSRGLDKVLTEPLGHGVGTSDLRFKDSLLFFVESAWWNLGFELGLAGLLLYIAFNAYNLLLFERGLHKTRVLGLVFPYDLFALGIGLSTLIVGFFSINVTGTTYIFYYWIIIGLAFKTAASENLRTQPTPPPVAEPEPVLEVVH